METLDEIEARAREYAATAALPGGYVRTDVVFLSDAILALVAHVRENGLAITDVREDAMHTNGSCARAVERIAALDAKVDALEARKGLDPKAVGLVSEMHRERDAEIVRLRAENAELRKRVAELEKNTYLGIIPPEWPAPQPIETAPLGRIMVWVDSLTLGDTGYWSYLVSTRSDTLETWRAALRGWGHRWWTPEPPPPGGGK